MSKTDLVPLDSIGSMLDSTNGLIYPMNTDGTADMHDGTATDVREVDTTVLCFKLSDKDFNSNKPCITISTSSEMFLILVRIPVLRIYNPNCWFLR